MTLDYAMPVLVVEDYKSMLIILRNLLYQLGFTDIDEAMNGEEA